MTADETPEATLPAADGAAPPPESREKKPGLLRRLLPRLGLVLGGLLVGLLLAEGLARLIEPEGGADLLFQASDGSPPGLYLGDRNLLVVPNPGFTGENRALDTSVLLRINQLGLRGPEVGPKQGRRWLVAGDSFTFAAQVPEEQTFVGQLSAQRGEEFLNAGVDGYSTWQAAGRYVALEPKLDVDGVVLVFFLGNDIHDNRNFVVRKNNSKAIKQGEPIARQEVPAWSLLLLQRSAVYAQVRVWQRRQALMGDQGMEQRNRWADELGIFHQRGTSRLSGLIRETRGALRELQQRTRERGDGLLVAVAPPAFVVDRDRAAATMEMVGLDPDGLALDAPARAVGEVLQGLGIQSCDLQPALEASQERGEQPYYTFDGHWTPAGHRAVAGAIDACMGGAR